MPVTEDEEVTVLEPVIVAVPVGDPVTVPDRLGVPVTAGVTEGVIVFDGVTVCVPVREEEAVFVEVSGVTQGDKLVVNLGIPEGRAREAEEGGGEEAAPSAVHVAGSHVRGRLAS